MNVDSSDPEQGLSGNILIRVPQGTTAAFEETLMNRMQAAEPGWSFDVRPLEQIRASNLRFRLMPLILGAVIASFLSMTVALGLVGVLWQHVTQRTREMGLRRAIGASAARVRTQVLGELMVVTSFSLILGTLVVIQIPLTGMASRVEGGVFMVEGRSSRARDPSDHCRRRAGDRAELEGRLFTPFLSTRRDGRGIGLTVIHEILTNHGFAFSLRNRPGGGAQFEIIFS